MLRGGARGLGGVRFALFCVRGWVTVKVIQNFGFADFA